MRKQSREMPGCWKLEHGWREERWRRLRETKNGGERTKREVEEVEGQMEGRLEWEKRRRRRNKGKT